MEEVTENGAEKKINTKKLKILMEGNIRNTKWRKKKKEITGRKGRKKREMKRI